MAYGVNEPDYSLAMIKETDSEYKSPAADEQPPVEKP